MKSTSLTCQATNCVHNQGCDCMAGVINVKGINATVVSDTNCNTFVEEGGYSFDNLSSYNDDEKTIPEKIKCSVRNCKYNEEERCHANNVEIIAANAACKTFECRL